MSTLIPQINLYPYPEVSPTFKMLVGIPGSGKSTVADEMMTANTKYISSDKIRGELYGDENCQQDHNRVFSIMRDRTIDALKNGYDVIYDATNVTRKNRKSILDQLPPYVTKQCFIVWAPIEECVRRDSERARSVGEEVITKIVHRYEAPFYDEGFDLIQVLDTVNIFDTKYYEDCVEALKIPHDNPHHSVGVYEHCQLCGKNLEDKDVPQVVKISGYLHDIGKPATKTFMNRKGEPCDIAHYYDHQAVGAWMACGFPGHDVILSWLISSHMAPFINQKYYNSLDPIYKSWIDALHEADCAAH